MKKHAPWTSYLPVTFAILAGLILTLAGYLVFLEVEQRQIRAEFEGAARNRVQAVQKVMELRIFLMKAIRALFTASDEVTAEEFRTFVEPVLARPNMVHAFAWLPRVLEEGSFPIRYAEPVETHGQVLGFDLASEPGPGEALRKARDTGEAVRTTVASLTEWGLSAHGFQAFVPVYRGGMVEGGMALRRERLMGFIAGVFQMESLVDSSMEYLLPQGIDFTIRDLMISGENPVCYTFTYPETDEPGFLVAPVEASLVEELEYVEKIGVGAGDWEIRFRPTFSFIEDQRTWYPMGMVPMGLLLTGLISGYILSLRGRAAKIQALVDARTADLVQANEELKATQLQLIQAEKMESVGRLAAGVAHEVKNPLAIIQLGVDYLEKTIKEDQDQIEVVQELDEAVRQADTVVKGLMDFAKTHKMDMEGLDPNTVLDDSLRMVRHDMTRHKIELVKDLSSDLPRVEMDRNKIQQVLLNLFMNAIQAMEGPGTLTVRSALVREEEAGSAQGDSRPASCVRLAVEDTGPGIPEEALTKIFDPFFTTKAPGQGTGLGLSVSRNIIELHKGRLDISNKTEGGASFTMTFPIQGDP